MIRAIDQIIEANNQKKISALWKRCDLTWEEKFLMAGWFDAPKISKTELAKEIESHPSIFHNLGVSSEDTEVITTESESFQTRD